MHPLKNFKSTRYHFVCVNTIAISQIEFKKYPYINNLRRPSVSARYPHKNAKLIIPVERKNNKNIFILEFSRHI